MRRLIIKTALYKHFSKFRNFYYFSKKLATNQPDFIFWVQKCYFWMKVIYCASIGVNMSFIRQFPKNFEILILNFKISQNQPLPLLKLNSTNDFRISRHFLHKKSWRKYSFLICCAGPYEATQGNRLLVNKS